MKLNVGNLESVLRISLGTALLYGALYGYIGRIGLLGILIIATGLGRFSPIKAVLGMSNYHEDEVSHH